MYFSEPEVYYSLSFLFDSSYFIIIFRNKAFYTLQFIIFAISNNTTMKLTILLPTDFSYNSLVTMKYAQGLAKYLNADIHILHAYKAFVTAFQNKMVNEADAYRAKYEAETEMVKFLDNLTKQEKTIVTTSIIEGNLVDVIQHYESINSINLIVMGTHG